MVAFLQADVFHFRALLDDHAAAFHFQVFNQHHGIAVVQHRAVGIFHHDRLLAFIFRIVFRPFVGAFGANQLRAIVVGQ